MEPHEKIERTKRQIFINNFIGGIAWGLGATIGLAIVLTTLGLVVSKVNLIPVVGTFVSNILSFVLQNNPQLMR
ncbi:MAG: hypothetical protein A3C27_00665 [Candidatus Levybacteria bacterium RIFCSPHIGHO2_02_FULL_39_36]|nr:MAG: hypothetical protein UT20_C0030G0020 [Candidatus Levybacteria bacterium GW2011_GWA1_39_11]KKR25341.1 MAG: hypothetical protein UT56_C0001G0072 [Candidatus Levybacteria bacterium GW2011_GWB1_39_7]KKR50412.1 MAG: hypothetical protein UT85_C0002G0020 [Candidatus Levybacteria bacterium GW2011_GWA2_40_16]OGH15441.1 MAG: hypothetical protein A2689_00750 [Candidatus Levybacteria bacterium RIFCSPHIGHO2_01_FULL_38_96]OGH25507.1 MAG: hypothetical protein A3E68_02395 [Candidatus Levybacteria bacte